MANYLFNKLAAAQKLRNNPNKKILITFVVLFILRFGNGVPLTNIDQEALRKSLLEMDARNPIIQLVNMYAGVGGKSILTIFSLGIIPYINASILVDLLTAIFPYLEKLQSEEGEMGRKKLTFYKKLVTFFFAIIQSCFLVFYLKPYVYNINFFNLSLIVTQLVIGSLMIVWLTTVIDNKGIGNGTSLIIFANIVNTFTKINIKNVTSIEIIFFIFIFFLISISQIARTNIKVVSARQLAFLENIENDNMTIFGQNPRVPEGTSLSLKLNQAGIFPIIIASNLLPFISYLSFLLGKELKIIETIFYYLCIIVFNYFYTIVFWDPEKISEQLRKASVSLVDVTPGQDTVVYLNRVVRTSSLSGGVFLCYILLTYDIVKQTLNTIALNQLNISSLIILIGVTFEIQKTIKALYKNVL
jgi:preprotein translocase subunit SecY